MAEGLLGGILRDYEEPLAVKAPEALAGPEAFAAAIADHEDSRVIADVSMFTFPALLLLVQGRRRPSCN
jgi:hypothetical protein